MILLFNVFITDQPLSTTYNRGLFPFDDRLITCKYSLASLSVIPFTRQFIYVSLDDNYKSQQQELEEYIYSLFPNASLFWHRNQYQRDWQWVTNTLPDELVWYSCNDDHIFLDYNLDWLDEIVQAMQDSSFQYNACYYSHYPEMLKVAASHGAQMHGHYVTWQWANHDSIQIMNKALLQAIWFDYDYKGAYMPRPDYYTQAESPPAQHFLPLREFSRHYDGYGHTGVNILPNECPPLRIPPGFFENDIKIRYGYSDNLPESVNINPSKSNYSTIDPNGTDYKWTLTDIPLFWRSRISQTDINPSSSTIDLTNARNTAVRALYTAMKCTIPEDWLVASTGSVD